MADITVASTTDSIEDVKLAAGLPAEGEEVETETPETEATPEGEEETPETKGDSEKPESETEPEEGSDKPAAASEAATKEEEGGKKRGGFQKRIDRLTEEKYDLIDENRTLKERLAEVNKTGGKTAVPETKVEGDPEPKRDQFKTDQEYQRALGKWDARQEIRVEQAKAEVAEREEMIKESFDTYNRAVDAFKEEHDDYDELVGNPKLMIPEAVQVAIVELGELGPEIAYYLASHPKACDRLADMSDARGIAEIGMIVARLHPEGEEEEKTEDTPPEPKKPVSRAPKPIKPTRTSSTQSTVPLDETDYQTYRKVRDTQEKGRFRR